MNPAKTVKVPPLVRLSEMEKADLNAPHLMGFKGARCDVKIDLTERYSRLYEMVGLPRGGLQGRALVDTGAIATSIDKSAAKRLNMEVVSRTLIQTAYKGTIVAPMFSCTMTFSGYSFVIQNAPGADLERFGLIAIIGRDILLHGVHEYSGVKGDWSFTIPNLSPA